MKREIVRAVSVFFVCAGVCVARAGSDDWVDLYDAVTAAGQSLTATSTGLYMSESGNESYLFNGVVYSAKPSEGQRVLIKKPASGNPSVTVTLPDDASFATGQRLALRRVDLFPVTYYGNAKNRMPTEYKVYGITTEKTEVELLHAKNLEYPDLGDNAKSNEFYSVAVTEDAKSEQGFRSFKIEILSTPVMASAAAGGIVASFMEIRLQVEMLDDALWGELYDERNLAKDLRAAGYYPAAGDWTSGQNSYGGYGAHNAFDGVSSVVTDGQRWLGQIHNANGCYAEMRIPTAYAPNDGFLLGAYRVWCLSTSGNEIRRAPTAYKLLAVTNAYTGSAWTAADDTGWTEISSLTGVDWSEIPYTTNGRNTQGRHEITTTETYRAFRFRPLATTATAESETGIDFGLNEVELLGRFVNPKGTLRVRATATGCDFGTSPGDGATITASGTITAPEYVMNGLARYRVTGYRIETFDYDARDWVRGNAVEERSYAYERDESKSVRLVWLLKKEGYVINAALDDGGNETVTVEPLQDCYAADDEVTITAHPNTDVLEEAAGATNKFRSAFVRWDGDTNGIADVTSPTVTVTVGEGRRLVPVFRRDWLVYEYDKANEGGTGTEWRMRDGNFEIRLSKGDLVNHSLAYGTSQWLISGHGSFDLDTTVVWSSDGKQEAINEMRLPQLGSNADRRADFTRIVLPKGLVAFRASSFRDQTNLVEAVVDCPNLTTLSAYLFTRDTALTRLVLKVPKLTRIITDYTFYNAPLDETDASTWQLDSLADFTLSGNEARFSLGEYAQVKDGAHGFYGTLKLPAAVRIGRSDFSWQRNMTAVELGTARGTLAEIGINAFGNCTALASVTIGCGPDLAVGQDAFAACSALRNITFLKSVPNAEALDRMLLSRSSADRANIYVTPCRNVCWSGFAQEIDTALDGEAPKGAFGVYQTAAGVRKAWIFYKESPLDPKGLRLIIN